MQKDLQRFRSANCITYNISAEKKAASPCIIHPSKSSQLVTYFTYIHNIYIIVHIEFPCKSSMLPPSLTVHDSRRRYAQSYHNYSWYLVISLGPSDTVTPSRSFLNIGWVVALSFEDTALCFSVSETLEPPFPCLWALISSWCFAQSQWSWYDHGECFKPYSSSFQILPARSQVCTPLRWLDLLHVFNLSCFKNWNSYNEIADSFAGTRKERANANWK